MNHPLDFLTAADLGTRVVVRTRIADGYTDALGYLRSRNATHCTVETKRGTVSLVLAEVVAAKEVPPPPPPRPRRHVGD
ncbi:ferrous iron transport protein A [Cryobacterium adonitolivorans]|uniref:Ferrous iron transport protein A n=1 Tax=Cryobacterium adonitolivorans TaxID=1259189 RepID=A0A4R8WE24_9MICO|nr:ferrous iron transport protein A [Cryobacterium adonitolivorans]TFC05608.1 ferrous iron transport protein A [Cryobacterium adonitolivorans]